MIYLLGRSFFLRRLGYRIPQNFVPFAGIFFLLTIGSQLVIRLNLRVDDAVGGLTLIDNSESAPRLLLDVLIGFISINLLQLSSFFILLGGYCRIEAGIF